MVKVMKAASAAAFLTAVLGLGASADTISVSLDGVVDLAQSGIDDSALIDGETFELSFSVDTDVLVAGAASGTAFIATTPQMTFAQSGVNVEFEGAGINFDLVSDPGIPPYVVGFLNGEVPDLFLEMSAEFALPDVITADSLLQASQDAKMTGVAFTFAGGASPIGSCAGQLFCGLEISGNPSINLIDDSMTPSVTPVPLPAGLLMLLSALGLVGATRLRRAS